jgi:hypothetical protein
VPKIRSLPWVPITVQAFSRPVTFVVGAAAAGTVPVRTAAAATTVGRPYRTARRIEDRDMMLRFVRDPETSALVLPTRGAAAGMAVSG